VKSCLEKSRLEVLRGWKPLLRIVGLFMVSGCPERDVNNCYEKFFHAKPRSREKEKFWWASLPLSPPFSWFPGVPKGREKLLRKVLSREAAKPRKRKVLVGFAAAQPTLFMVSGCPEGT
jgi:hypothetical protein